MLMIDTNIATDTMLLACIVDRLSSLIWMQSADGHKNQNRPASILAEIVEKQKPKEYMQFRSIDDFERTRQNIING